MSQVWADNQKDQAGQPLVYVRFPKSRCQACPARVDCTRSNVVLPFMPRRETAAQESRRMNPPRSHNKKARPQVAVPEYHIAAGRPA